jgi:1-deoxyxylulose-5-phosphate synthase
LHKPGVVAPEFGATRLGRIEDALAAKTLSLNSAEIARLEELYVPYPVLGHR